jgi:Mg-chelatase subunit ChlI
MLTVESREDIRKAPGLDLQRRKSSEELMDVHKQLRKPVAGASKAEEKQASRSKNRSREKSGKQETRRKESMFTYLDRVKQELIHKK